MIGRTLSHYNLIEEVGAGGRGVVYRAQDTRLERDVAVKVLAPGRVTDGESRRRFRQEALILSRLNHPNVQTVHDFDTQEGTDFIVSEWIAGESLDSRITRGPLSEDEVNGLGRQLARGSK